MNRLANLDPKKRELYLMILCGLMLVIASFPFGFYLFGSAVSQMRTRTEATKKNLAELENKQTMGLVFEKRVKQNAAQSLPAENELAVAEYKNWLTTLISHFEGGQVVNNGTSVQRARVVRGQTNARDPGVYYTNYKFTLSGKTTLNDLGRFLQQFYEVKTLHLIRGMTVKPIDNAQRVEVSITIEAISIPQTLNKTYTAQKKDDDETPWSRMIAAISSRNFFAPYAERPPENAAQQLTVVSASKHTYLNGVTWSNDRPQAWFNFRLEGRQGVLKVGDQFRVGETNCRIEAINTDRTVEVRVEASNRETGKLSRTVWSLTPGDTLFDAEFVRDIDEEEDQTATTTVASSE